MTPEATCLITVLVLIILGAAIVIADQIRKAKREAEEWDRYIARFRQ